MHLQIKIKFFDALRKVGQVFFQRSIYKLLKWNVLNLGDDFQNLIQLHCGWCIFSTQNAENSICSMNLKIQNISKTFIIWNSRYTYITIWEISTKAQSLEFDNTVLCENSLNSLQKRCRRHKKHTWCDTNLLGMKTFPKKKPLSLSVNISRVLLILGDKIMNKSEGIFLCKLKGNKTFSKILQCKWGKRRALTQFSSFLPKRIERIKNR